MLVEKSSSWLIVPTKRIFFLMKVERLTNDCNMLGKFYVETSESWKAMKSLTLAGVGHDKTTSTLDISVKIPVTLTM